MQKVNIKWKLTYKFKQLVKALYLWFSEWYYVELL